MTQRSAPTLACAVVASAIVASAIAAWPAMTRAAAQGQAQGQAPAVIFRAAVDYVEIDATVTDANGRVVTDLTREDFELKEDNRPQTIESFSHVTLPTDAASPPTFADHPVEADVQQNAGQDGRLYVFVFDDLHIDASRTVRARSVAKDFIATQFRPNDLGAVLFTSGSGRAGQDLTGNRRLLLAAADRFIGEGDAVANDFNDRRTVTTLRGTTEFLAGVRGRRKAILFFSEGPIPVDVSASMAALEMQDAIAAATRGNVRYYPIDPKGLDAPDMMPGASLFGGRAAKDSLQALAVNTGGIALLNRNNLTTGYAQIVAENSSYFVLGYSSTNDRQDGKFRKVSVKVRRSGLHVQARGGYYAARGRERPAATDAASDADPAHAGRPLSVEALSSPLGLSGIPMRMFAAAFRPPQAGGATAPRKRKSSNLADVTIAAELDVSRFTLTPSPGEAPEHVEVSVLATNVNGKVTTGLRQSAPLSLSPTAADAVRAKRLRVLSHLSLAPGRYQLRLAATVAGTAGSVVYDMDVPDFFKAPLSMSGIVITSDAATDTVTLLDKAHRLTLSGSPVATRRFTSNEELTMLVELYEKADGPRHALALAMALQAENGDIVRRSVERRAADRALSASGGQTFTSHLSLQGLTPGPYLLHVEGHTEGDPGAVPSVSRDIAIEVTP